ncbi:MAG: phage holin family protein [Candidatus Roizmanbacteria bacterium]|nr:phage holin family protein [Candidatus Roizmanbacteria bacterium]
MKNIFRIFIFSCFALFLTSYWNKGFILPSTSLDFVKAAIALTILFVLVRPLMKVVFLPLNILTFGLFSFFLYVFLLHILSSGYGLFSIRPWQFYGLNISVISVPKTAISYISNLVLSSFSLSSIINLLDQLT